MRGALGITIIGLIIFVWEGRMLWKQKRKREMVVFSSSLLLAVMLYAGVALHLPIPSPTEVIGRLLEPIVKPIFLWTRGGSS